MLEERDKSCKVFHVFVKSSFIHCYELSLITHNQYLITVRRYLIITFTTVVNDILITWCLPYKLALELHDVRLPGYMSPDCLIHEASV